MANRFREVISISVVVTFLFTGLVFLSDCRASEKTTRVTMETNMGSIVLELNSEKAPLSAANFLRYVDEGFYDATIFHRVVGNFVIQGGGFDEDLNQKETGNQVPNEAGNGLLNEAYTLAMARTQNPHSATSQFYINLKENPALNKSAHNDGYTVFGKVVEGKAVVDAIGAVKTTTTWPHQNVPVNAVVINRISRSPQSAPEFE